MAATEREILGTELRWAGIVAGVIAVIIGAIIYAALAMHINPPSNIEFVDPKSLHLTGEFTESNLGTQVDLQGRVTVRVVTAQFAFVPHCAVVPKGRPVTLRFSSPDVIHGIIVAGTNVNTMVVPGYVSQVHATFQETGDLLMPCHEYCGLGHSQMWATIRVVPPSEFKPDASGRVDCEGR